MKERRFVMWIITDFGQFVLLKVRLALNSICAVDFIVLLLMLEG